MEKVRVNIVNLVKQHPDGIPLKKMAEFYNRKYHHNLTCSALGFKTLASLIESLDEELVVKGQQVFHKIHKAGGRARVCVGTGDGVGAGTSAVGTENSCPTTPVRTKFKSAKDPPPATPSDSPSTHINQLSHAFRGKDISTCITVVPSSSACRPASPVSLTSTPKPLEKLSQEQLYQRVLEVIQVHPCAARSMEQMQNFYYLHFGEILPLQQFVSLCDNLEEAPHTTGHGEADQLLVQGTAALKKPAAAQCLKMEPEGEQKSSTPSFSASLSDFPALGAEGMQTKSQKKKLRDEALKEKNAQVFVDYYHAQVRVAHGANMRAADLLEGENEDSKGRRRNNPLDMEAVNSLVEDVVRELAAEGELVTRERVISRVCMLMQVPSLEAGKIKSWTVPALRDLQYTIREINMFIEATEASTSICTLYELGQSLAALKDKRRYEELSLGPLCKLPLIHRMFKIDPNTKDDDIPQIETVDILKCLRLFRTKQRKPKVDLTEFMQHLADQYNCDSPYELGIRIQGLGLPIGTIMKVNRKEHSFMDHGQMTIQRELEEEVQERMRKIKRSVMEPAQGPVLFSSIGSSELRKKYVSMTAGEAVLEIFMNAAEVFTSRMNKLVQDFLLQVSGDRLARALFQLAICGGSLAAPQDLVLKDKPSKRKERENPEDKPTVTLPSEATIKQYLKDNLSSYNSAVTLANIASLERKLIQNFQVKGFHSLEQGTFLEFLVKHIQLLQETVGSSVSLGGRGMDVQGSGFRPSRQDVIEFIKQCGVLTPTDSETLAQIEAALRVHYRVQDSRDLGFSLLQTVAAVVRCQMDMSGGGGPSQVYYESALFAQHSSAVCESVGLLGELAQSQALASLLSCPLLEDLGQWSQWELVFKPFFGTLKDFIERNAANTDLAALEVSPGVLLRITTYTGDKFFSQAAMTLDPVGTAGHLVSIVVTDGITNTPTALLANHMESSLAAAVAKEDLSRAEEDVSCYNTVARFLLECLIRIPVRTCRALLPQVFLEPLSRVLGQAKSKAVLLGMARSDPRHLNYLHQLGILLGITEWTKDYHNKLTPPQSHNNLLNASVDKTKSNLEDSLSSSLSGLNLSEDENLEDATLDYGFNSPLLNHSQQANGEQEVEDEDDDEEQLYELKSLPNGEVYSPCEAQSETDGSHEDGQFEMADSDEDAASNQSENAETPQRTIIEDIRKNEFGIGMELTAESLKLMKVNQDRLGRSLDRLSAELYSKDAHFVLELIQNADDNDYPSEASPALAFVVEGDCVTILNNESGFQEKNIRAVCDVGRTTKGKHKYGYIGQKGIGFKSVFKVTDCPEIHSNGFHLRFDKNSGPTGYILPHWIDDERPVDTARNGLNEYSWTTKICLPLRSDTHQTKNLFHDVHPSLLLFLHRLRSITIHSHREKSPVTMTRRDLSHNIVEVEHTEGTERWLLVKRMLQPKKVKEDVESTELALAFQLGDTVSASDLRVQPQKQPVFAFLPLRSFGFRFIIQGDFDIPSSREDVDRDSSWNQWLRSEIPQLFLQAMEVFTIHPEFSGLKGLCNFLQFVPLPDEALDFFKPVAGQIIQLLKGKAFLPTLSSGGHVVYKLPSQVAICQDTVIRDVIGAEELDRHLSLAYLHPGLHPAPPLTLLKHLGVRHLRGSDVTTVTMAMAKELMQGQDLISDGGLRQLARLLVCNFRALEHGYGDTDSILQTLRELPIIPLADGHVVALSAQGVFFPMEKTKKKKKKAEPEMFSALYKDVSVVHPSLLCCEEPLEAQQVRELLRKLGVHELEPQQLLEQHIYPALHNGSWKSKPEPVVVNYLVFIKQYSSSSQEYSDTAVPVLTSRGLLCPAQDRVHFSQEYGNINLPEKLPGHDWVLLSSCYVETDNDVAGWRELFTRLGVRDRLLIRKQRRTLTAEELASSTWSAESELWSLGLKERGCVLDDYPSEEFHSLATAQLPAHQLLEQRQTLLRLLVDNWNTGDNYSQYLTADVIDNNGHQVKTTKSSFFHFLARLKWVFGLLGTHVCYVDIQPSEFSRALGMKHNISVEELTSYLKKWCIKPEAENQDETLADESDGSDFTSTIQHIHNVYSYLQKNFSQSSLKELFQHTPAVFIEHSRRDNGWCSGHFHHLKEVCWRDPTTMFQRYKQLVCNPGSNVQQPRVLAPFYSQLEGMKDFFTRLLNVEHSPNMKQYVDLLELISSSSPIPTASVLQDVSVLYAKLAQKCKIPMSGDHDDITQTQTNSSYCSTLKGMLVDKRVFPTKENTWVTLARRPMIADSKELEKIFKPRQQVCLLNMPPPTKTTGPASRTGNQQGQAATKEQGSRNTPCFSESNRSLFLQICGVRRLSECVRTEAQTEVWRPSPFLQNLVRSMVPYIQRFLYHHDELTDVYAELLDDHIGNRIKQLSYGQVGKLYIHYLLSVPDEVPVVEVEDVICLLKDRKEFYIQQDHLSPKLDICRELVKLFCLESSHQRELLDFLSRLMTSLSDPSALKRFLHREDVKELPPDQEPWEVPEVKQERVLPKGSTFVSTQEEPPRPGQEDRDQTLISWPPRAPIQNICSSTGGGHADANAVEAVMKMWPPPAPPKDRDTEREVASRGGSHVGVPQSPANALEGNPPPRAGDRPADPHSPYGDHSLPSRPSSTVTTTGNPQSSERSQQSGDRMGQTTGRGEPGEEWPKTVRTDPSTANTDHAKTDMPDNHVVGPEAVVLGSMFQGAGGVCQRPPLALDFAQWNKAHLPLDTLENMELTCQIPNTVVLSDEPNDLAEIGEWGEQLVNSFLCHWKDSGAPGCPSAIIWCNQHAESGQPYDFKLTFGPTDGPENGQSGKVVYVEVKATVKTEKAFIHLSANELDFALKEKERYHVYRVYCAGDAKNVRLCRIQNLAQHLHAKDLKLFLFI